MKKTLTIANFSRLDGGEIGMEELPESDINLWPSLTEEQMGNAMLEGLEIVVNVSEDTLIGGEVMMVDISTINISRQIKSLQFVLALHDANGMLIDAQMHDLLIAPNWGDEVNLSIMLPADVYGYHLRIMVWDSYGSDAPHTLMIVTGGD